MPAIISPHKMIALESSTLFFKKSLFMAGLPIDSYLDFFKRKDILIFLINKINLQISINTKTIRKK